MSDHGPRQLLLLQQLQQLLAAAAAAAASLGLSNRALSACRTAAGRLAKLALARRTYVRAFYTCSRAVQYCRPLQSLLNVSMRTSLKCVGEKCRTKLSSSTSPHPISVITTELEANI